MAIMGMFRPSGFFPRAAQVQQFRQNFGVELAQRAGQDRVHLAGGKRPLELGVLFKADRRVGKMILARKFPQVVVAAVSYEQADADKASLRPLRSCPETICQRNRRSPDPKGAPKRLPQPDETCRAEKGNEKRFSQNAVKDLHIFSPF